jgi:hypothetical protein
VIEKEMEETETFDYLSNVLNWRAEPFVGKHQLCPSVRFGPYTLTELIDAEKTAADASGFATYAFRGARKSETSCSIKFGCDHGRLRYGKEKQEISAKKRDFVKNMEEVVHDQPGKRRRPRKSGGYKRSKTQRQRVKTKDCPFTICLKSCGDNWGPNTRCMWTLNVSQMAMPDVPAATIIVIIASTLSDAECQRISNPVSLRMEKECSFRIWFRTFLRSFQSKYQAIK